MNISPAAWESAPFLQYAIIDMDGVLRAKNIHHQKLRSGLGKGLGFCDVIFGWDMVDEVYGHLQESGHRGFPDVKASIDMDSFRMLTLGGEETPFLLADFRNADSRVAEICPRTLLYTQQEKALEMGFLPYFGGELEWFVFEETPASLTQKDHRSPQSLSPGMFGYSGLRLAQFADFWRLLWNRCESGNVPLEGLHTETGPGAYEAALQKAPVLEAADRVALFKHLTKSVYLEQRRMASFMAKWSADLPGCGGHIHQSLWDKEGNVNLFQATKGEPNALLSQYLAGQLLCLPVLMPMLAPTINSYKRLAGGDWAPRTATWGYDNRTAALRLITLTERSARLENRVPGADAHPHLAMAACLAAGLYGIEHKLSLEQAASLDSGYGGPELPLTLKEATAAMEASDLPKQLFGERFVSHFIQTRKWEVAQYEKQVGEWERKRYMEII